MSEQSPYAGERRARGVLDSARGRRARRVGAGTVVAGAFVFLTVSAGPAVAATSAGQTSHTCHLGFLLCTLLGQGASTPAPEPTPTPTPKPSGGSSTKPTPKPERPSKPAAPGRRAHARPHVTAPRAVLPYSAPASILGGAAPTLSLPAPATLPDLTSQDPRIAPDPIPDIEPARLAAATSPRGSGIPAPLVATASGVIGALAAFNASALSRRYRRRPGTAEPE